MSKFDFVEVAVQFDEKPSFSLTENRAEQRQAEQLFLNKLAMMMNDFLIKNREPTRSTETELSSGDDT